jgi:hypothetical protein
VITLSAARNARTPSVRAGRLPRYVVAKFVGGAVSAAFGWVRGKRLDFRARLGPLKAGNASGLFANYRVTRQQPPAGARLALGQRTKPAKGRGGGFRLTPLTVWGVQPVPARPAAPCTPPPGYTVIASSPEAVITSHQSQGNVTLIGWYGCLRAVGAQRLLATWTESDGYWTDLGQVVLAGRFAAFSFSGGDKYQDCVSAVAIYDLSTGQPSGGYSAVCPSSGTPPGLDSLSLNANGFAAWRETEMYPPTPLYGMSCPSASLCVATDAAGNVVTSTDPTGGSGAWTVAHVEYLSGVYISAVSCPSVSLCVATDAAGNVITSTDPTGGPGAWTVTHVDSGPYNISAVSCPSVSLCVATDGAGNVIASTDPTGGQGAWTVAHLVGSGPFGLHVSCPSTSLCVATDGMGDVMTSANPTGGAGAWTVTRVSSPTNSPYAISCPSASLCVASGVLGNLLTSTNPTGGASAWTVTTIPGAGVVQTMSCPSASLCLAGDISNNLLISTNPTGGGTTWTATQLPTGREMTSVSCPSTSLCVAGDTGNVLTSSNPTGGPSAWSSTMIDPPPPCTAQWCPVANLYASDNQGTRLLDSTPPGAGGSLTNVKLNGNLLTWTHDGTPHQATLH